MNGNFKAAWSKLETSSAPPRFLRNIIKVDFSEFRKQVLNPTLKFVGEITESLYAGDVYILKNALAADYLKKLKHTIFEYGKKNAEGSKQILDGCPNFHYKSDEKLERPKNGYVALDHSYYFFRWNEDTLSLFKAIDPIWEMAKLLGGFKANEYVKNTPSDYYIDKIQVIHYPTGVGGISVHSDPYSRQKTICGIELTEYGKDYQSGGYFILNSKKEKVLLSPQIECGSSTLVFPSLFHGVETIDRGKPTNWDSINGRWFFTGFTIDSHLVENREKALSPTDWKEAA